MYYILVSNCLVYICNIIYNFSKREEKKKLYSMVNINKTGNNKNISTDYGNKRKNKNKNSIN